MLIFTIVACVLVGVAYLYVKVPGSISLPSTGEQSPRRFPAMQVKNLRDEVKSLPADFPSEKTLLLIAYEREQQDNLDDWSDRMKLREPGAPAWLELPVIDDPGACMRWFVDVGMKSGIADPAVRARVFSVYTPRELFNRHLGLSSTDQVHLVVADRTGTVLCSVSGNWTAEKERNLREALK